MNAIILAAGKSERLKGLGLGLPKPLIEVRGKPLLVHHLETCARLGLSRVFINLHFEPEQIPRLIGDGSRWGIHIHYHYEPEVLGTAGGARSFAKDLDTDSCLIIYGDNFFDFDLSELIEAHRRTTPDMSIMVFHKENVQGSGVVCFDQEGRISKFVEKPESNDSPSHWVNAGAYIMSRTLLESIKEGFSDFGKDIIPNFLSEGKRIMAVATRGSVLAVDTPELYSRVLAQKQENSSIKDP